jgi:hypothetical protein
VIVLNGLAMVLFKGIDRPIDFVYEKIITKTGEAFAGVLSKAHTGHYANYLAWCLGGLVAIAALINALLK